ncbi:MAG: CRISPR-associated protein Cas4 [Pseudonocardiaceae bacterium]
MHRKVDVEFGAAPLPEDGELGRARSVAVNSEQLRVIAKLDLIEGDGGNVRPVDFTKGCRWTTSGDRRRLDGTPWPSDEVQVCVQALLLREHGYQCDHAELWYAETCQRLWVELTPERLSWPADLVADANALVDSREYIPMVTR